MGKQVMLTNKADNYLQQKNITTLRNVFLVSLYFILQKNGIVNDILSNFHTLNQHNFFCCNYTKLPY